MPERICRCFLLLMFFMFLLALTTAEDFEVVDIQSKTDVSEPEGWGMFLAGTPHGPIAIDGDANFSTTALLEGWLGDGSPENPYIIDGFDINLGGAVGDCISIRNTRVHFTIRNCNLIGASGEDFGAGINLENVAHGELLNNIVEDNRLGIYVANSYYSTISDNTCSNNTESGIWLTGSDFSNVVNNTCYKNLCGIGLGGSPMAGEYGARSNNVTDNVCNNNDIGISLVYSESNVLENNTCTSNGEGIAFVYSSLNTVINNNCSNNTEHGIHISESDSTIITNNVCNNNDVGILLEGLEHTVVNNICNNNRVGIYLRTSFFNTVADNTCLGNTEYGIYLSSSPNNTVMNNICNNNGIGIYFKASDGNIVADNTCLGNTEYGIYLNNSDYNTVTNNICNSNGIGIHFKASENNTLEYNISLGNIEYDIHLDRSDNNKVTNNFTDFDIVVLLMVGLGGITVLESWKNRIKLLGWWKVYASGSQDEIIVPTAYRLTSLFSRRKSLKQMDVDDTLEPDSSDQ